MIFYNFLWKIKKQFLFALEGCIQLRATLFVFIHEQAIMLFRSKEFETTYAVYCSSLKKTEVLMNQIHFSLKISMIYKLNNAAMYNMLK